MAIGRDEDVAEIKDDNHAIPTGTAFGPTDKRLVVEDPDRYSYWNRVALKS